MNNIRPCVWRTLSRLETAQQTRRGFKPMFGAVEGAWCSQGRWVDLNHMAWLFHVFLFFTRAFCVSSVCSLRNKSVSCNTLGHDVTFISINDSCVSKN